MGLFNPVLGNIPQPQKDKETVYNPILPANNYKAQVTTPLVNTAFFTTLQETGSGTTTYTTLKEIILTQIMIQGYYNLDAGDSGSVDVYINGTVIMSLNFDSSIADNNQHFFLNIPLEHCLFGAKSNLKMIVSTTGGMMTNCSFIGYEYTKQ
jgi:hypothetical protein